MSDSLNHHSERNMATVVKAIGEFTGAEGENIEEWLNVVEVLCGIENLSDYERVRVVMLCLREGARTWGVALLTADMSISWNIFKNELRKSYSSSKETAEVLSRFFSRGQSNTYDEYSLLL